MRELAIKVCGMRDYENIKSLAELQPDFMGFIFYEKSPRNANHILDENLLNSLPQDINKVGVFVNAHLEEILEKAEKYGFTHVQLHGKESPDFCKTVQVEGFKVIKAFSISEEFDFETLNAYAGTVDYYLFDTKGKSEGGNGIKFNWDLITNLKPEAPFFLSGGLELQDAEAIKALQQKNRALFAIDINSKFELQPGLKDLNKINSLINLLEV